LGIVPGRLYLVPVEGENPGGVQADEFCVAAEKAPAVGFGRNPMESLLLQSLEVR